MLAWGQTDPTTGSTAHLCIFNSNLSSCNLSTSSSDSFPKTPTQNSFWTSSVWLLQEQCFVYFFIINVHNIHAVFIFLDNNLTYLKKFKTKALTSKQNTIPIHFFSKYCFKRFVLDCHFAALYSRQKTNQLWNAVWKSLSLGQVKTALR